MKTRELGKTGITVSEIAFGGVEIGMPYGFNQNEMLPREAAVNLLHEALDNGITFFDTARLYGESESIMGEAFHDRRDKIVLATKCKHFKNQDGTIPPYTELEKIIESSLKESLGYLRTDYADVFMLHQADMVVLENDDVKTVFEKLKASGRVRAIGASTYSPEETHEAIKKGWEVIQLPFNLMDQRQGQNFAYAKEMGTGIVVRSVLMKGLLSDRGKNLHPALLDVEQHIGKFQSLLSDDITELPTLATKFALSHPEVSAVLVGIDKPEYLHKAVETISGNLLSKADLASAQSLAYPDPAFLDLPGWDRMGWLT